MGIYSEEWDRHGELARQANTTARQQGYLQGLCGSANNALGSLGNSGSPALNRNQGGTLHGLYNSANDARSVQRKPTEVLEGEYLPMSEPKQLAAPPGEWNLENELAKLTQAK